MRKQKNKKEPTHLPFVDRSPIGKPHLDVNIIAGRLLILGLPQLLHAVDVVDHNGIRGVEQRIQSLRDLGKLHAIRLEYLLEEGVAVDKLPLVGVLELVGLDVLPEGGDDDGPGLCVDPEEAGQPLVELELERLVVQQQQDGAPHVLVPGTLHLQTNSLL